MSKDDEVKAAAKALDDEVKAQQARDGRVSYSQWVADQAAAADCAEE